ncbi:MAG: hypothetical protein ACU0CO_12785 [Shimia sp.]
MKLRIANARNARTARRHWKGGSYLGRMPKIVAPVRLSISDAEADTLGFLEQFKEAVFTREVVRHRGRVHPRPVHLSLVRTTKISLPCAVILCAELQRWSNVVGIVPRLVDASRMDQSVKETLRELGGLRLLGIRPRKMGARRALPDQLTIIQMRSGDSSDTRALTDLQNELASLITAFSPRTEFTGGFAEAMFNSVEHAYSDAIEPRFPYSCGKRWWAAGCFDPVTSSLRFFMYDQGVGIPKHLSESVKHRGLFRDIVARVSGAERDPSIIAEAAEIGRTKTGLPQRGKGVGKMWEVIKSTNGGHMRIVSGRGDVVFHADGTLRMKTLGSHIGGTLVEWSIPLDAG